MLCRLSVSISGSVELLYLLMNLINFISLVRSSSVIIKLLTETIILFFISFELVF